MKERPILFSGPMVQAILEGRKTMTRRILKPKPKEIYSNGEWYIDRYNQGEYWCFWGKRDTDVVNKCGLPEFKCPYGTTGDRLWVRETWQDFCPLWEGAWCGHGMQEDIEKEHGVWYKAGPPHRGPLPSKPPLKWKSPLFMFRWASRITLEIVNVRVERVREITYKDWVMDFCPSNIEQEKGLATFTGRAFQIEYSQKLWDSLNGKKHPWESNPWVWVVEFRLVENKGKRNH